MRIAKEEKKIISKQHKKRDEWLILADYVKKFNTPIFLYFCSNKKLLINCHF